MTEPYVIERDTRIPFPSSAGGITTAVHPFLGPGNYKTLFNPANFQDDTRMPTGVDNADFVHAIYCGPKEFRESPEAQEAREKMRSTWLYVPVVTIWTPENFKVGSEDRFGVYSVFDQNGQGRDLEFNPEELEKSLRQGEKIDPKIILGNGVSFANRDTYNGGDHTSEEFARDGLIVVTYTPNGAQKLAEASKQFNNNPQTWIVNNPANVEKRVSGLDDYINRLGAYGYYNVDAYWAFSFGVKK